MSLHLPERLLRALAWLWLAVIVVSQTEWAGEAANRLASLLLGDGAGGSDIPRFLAQKGYHVIIFSVFAFFLTLPRGFRDWRTCAALSVGIGLLAEWSQALAPGRNPTPSDAMLNVAAGLATLELCRRFGCLESGPTTAAEAS